MDNLKGYKLTGILTTRRGRTIGAHRVAEAASPLLELLADLLEAIAVASEDRRWDEFSERFANARRAMVEFNARQLRERAAIEEDERLQATMHALKDAPRSTLHRKPMARVRRSLEQLRVQLERANKRVERARVEMERRREEMRRVTSGRRKKPDAKPTAKPDVKPTATATLHRKPMAVVRAIAAKTLRRPQR